MPAVDDATLDLFCQLSSVLTGEAVARTSALRNLETARESLGIPQVDQVLQRFAGLQAGGGNDRQVIGDQLVKDATVGASVKKIILLWFTGQMAGPTGAPAPTTQDDYYEALMWAAVGAHPPGLSNGYYGHWRYPPDLGV